MIGDDYKGIAIGAVLGPGHSPLIPSLLFTAWLDGSGTVIDWTGLTITHDVFEIVGTSVTNTDEIDGGVTPATTPTRFALCDADGGSIIASAPVTFTDGDGAAALPTEGEPLTIAPGALVFSYMDGAP